MNKKVHQLVGQCETRRRISERLLLQIDKYLLSRMPIHDFTTLAFCSNCHRSAVISTGKLFNAPRKNFPDAEVGDGAGDIYAICCRTEVADDAISGYNVETFLFLLMFW